MHRVRHHPLESDEVLVLQKHRLASHPAVEHMDDRSTGWPCGQFEASSQYDRAAGAVNIKPVPFYWFYCPEEH
jgi:hypothetical protein